MAEDEDQRNAPFAEPLHALLDESPPDALPLSARHDRQRRKDRSRDTAGGTLESRRGEQDVPKRLLVFAGKQRQYRLRTWVTEQVANQFGLLVAAERQAFNEQNVLEIRIGSFNDVHRVALSSGCSLALRLTSGR